MRKTFLEYSMILTILVSLMCTSCAASESNVAAAVPAENGTLSADISTGDPASGNTSGPETQIQQQPTPEPSYDFSNIELPPNIMDQSGFEENHWGDTLEDIIEGAPGNGVTNYGVEINRVTQFAGLDFFTEYRFQPDDSNALKLVWGCYYRYFHVNTYELQSDMEMKKAIEYYKILSGHLSQIYGEPAHSYVVTSDNVRIDGMENIDEFCVLQAREANMIWISRHGPVCIMSLTVAGELRLQFYSELYK